MAEDQGTRTEIGPETVVSGDVRADEDVVVFGRIDGTVVSSTAVIVEDGGCVGPRVEAPTVIVAGWAAGDVVGIERVEITETGRVLGNIYTPRLILLDGGAVKGRVVMDGSGPESTGATAAVRTSAAVAATVAGARRAAPVAPKASRTSVSSVRGRTPPPVVPVVPRAAANPGLLDLGDESGRKDS
jgi:cytoskeletal protein CcmA (bactofilin family)